MTEVRVDLRGLADLQISSRCQINNDGSKEIAQLSADVGVGLGGSANETMLARILRRTRKMESGE